MAEQWYYSNQGQRMGPVSEEHLKQLASSGQVQPTDLVWKKGMVQWTQASQVFPPPPPDPNAPPPITEGATHKKWPVSKPVVIAMAIAVSLPLLVSIVGVLAFLAGDLRGGTRNAAAMWMTFLQNGFALFACVMALRGTKQYWLPAMASVLTFVAWFWLSLSVLPLALVVAGTVVSIGIGIWSFVVLRKPEVRSDFVAQFDPVDSVAQFVLPRLPKFKIEATPTNVSRASVLSLCGLCVVGILIGSLLGEGSDSTRKWDQKDQSLVDLLKKSDNFWDSGRKDAAVEGYMQIISLEFYDRGAFEREHKLDMSRIYNRVVDYRVEQGNPDSVRDIVRKAAREPRLSITFSNPAASKIAAQEKAAYDREVARELASSGGGNESPPGKGNGKSDAELIEEGRQIGEQAEKEHPGLKKLIEDTKDQLRAKK